MKLWLSKNSEVPMREQIITQITLGIASGDLEVGEKLPSRGEISMRFDIHANTVSNAYQELAEKNLIEFKQGSGFYVAQPNAVNHFENDIATLTAKFISDAQTLGFSLNEIQASVNKHFQKVSAEYFLVIESDEDLREILIEEIKDATNTNVSGISLESFTTDQENIDAHLVALFDEEEKIQKILSSEKSCTFLKSSSVSDAMIGETRPEIDSMIAVVSSWDKFILFAKTMLVAADIDADSIIVRSVKTDNWKRGLNNVKMIICDSLTAKHFPNDKRIRPFSLIAENSLRDLCRIIDTSE